MRVLLVEDDQMLGLALVQALKDARYAVDWVQSINHAKLALNNNEHELILLDLGLPDGNGLDLVVNLRNRQDNRPVLIMTAKDDLSARVQGLDSGADDYVIKPFDVDELLARMRVLLRRQHGQRQNELHVADMILNIANHQVSIDQQSIMLTAKEFAVLQTLMISTGKIVSRTALESSIYGWNEEIESNAIDFLIFSLRKKIGSQRIKNIRGAGWMIPQH